MKKLLLHIIVLVFVMLTSVSFLAAQIKGKVTDNEGKAVAGVLVTNGRNVVVTNQEGVYELPVSDKVRFVTITKPAEYTAEGGFYLPYVSTQKSYDFVLKKAEKKNSFNFIQITDTELAGTNSWFRNWEDNVKDYAHNNNSAFVMHTGDICYEGGLTYHSKEMNTATMGVPTYYSLGNHDLLSGKYGEERFEALFGPVCFSFDEGNVHFIVTPMFGGDAKPSYIPGDIYEWMKNDLFHVAKGKPIVIFNHDYQNIYRPEREQQQFDLSAYNVKAVIFGHWHNHLYMQDEKSGIKFYSSSPPDKGGIDHSPACFRVFTVDEKGDISSQTRYSYMDSKLTVASPVQGQVSYVNSEGNINVVVNAYHTAAPTASVKAKWDDTADWIELKQQSDFSWTAGLTARQGDCLLHVEAVFANGNVINKKVNCRVATNNAPQVMAGNDWGNVRGNAGHNLQVTAPATLRDKLVLAWTNNAGGNVYMSSPVIGDNKLFVATIDDDKAENCFVTGYDALTGKELWRYKTVSSVRSNLLYEKGKVIACDVAGNVYAFDPVTGNLVWEKKLPVPMLPPTGLGIVAKDGVAYVGQQKGLSAIQVEDGRILWQNSQWEGGECGPAGNTIGNGVLLTSSQWSGLYAHDVITGNLLWKNNSAAVRFRDGGATFYNDKFYLATTKSLVVFDPKTGEIVQQSETPYDFQVNSFPIVTDSILVTATSADGIVAFNRFTFEKLWNYRTEPSLLYSVPYIGNHERSIDCSPVLIGDRIYFGASDGSVYSLEVKTGKCVWKYKLGAPLFMSPAFNGSSLYFVDFGGNIFSFLL